MDEGGAGLLKKKKASLSPDPQVAMAGGGGALGATGQPGLEPSQEPTVNIGGWLNGPWGLHSHVPF